MFVLTDFDRTLTKPLVNGKKSAVISVLRERAFLGQEYAQQAHALFDKYHPYEEDDTLTYEQRLTLMQQWWKEHYDLLKKYGFTRTHVMDACKDISLKQGVQDCITWCNEKNIPFIIFSSGGLGDAAIISVLERHGVHASDVHIVANRLQWDAESFSGVLDPVIPSGGKTEDVLTQFPAYQYVKGSGVLLGDSFDDVRMVTSVPVYKIGFALDTQQRALFADCYDVVLDNTDSFVQANSLVQKQL